MTTVQKNIRYLRRKRDWTQRQLADHIFIKRSLVGAWEEGRSEPKSDHLIALSKTFGETIDSLLTQDLRAEQEILTTSVR